MEMHPPRRCRILVLGLLLATATASPAALLVTFDFDTAGGGFEAGPDALHPRIGAAAWTDLLGTLDDFAGNPGRALSATGFSNGNALQLALTAQPGYVIGVDTVWLDLRASSSGPDAWRLSAGAGPALAGPVTTAFTTVGGALTAPALAEVVLTIDGDGASSAAGTLRIDNVEVHGTVSLVAVPPGVMLIVSPLAGMLLAATRRRYLPGEVTPVRTARRATHRRAESTARA